MGLILENPSSISPTPLSWSFLYEGTYVKSSLLKRSFKRIPLNLKWDWPQLTFICTNTLGVLYIRASTFQQHYYSLLVVRELEGVPAIRWKFSSCEQFELWPSDSTDSTPCYCCTKTALLHDTKPELNTDSAASLLNYVFKSLHCYWSCYWQSCCLYCE